VRTCNLYLGTLAADPHQPGPRLCLHREAETYFDHDADAILLECLECGESQHL